MNKPYRILLLLVLTGLLLPGCTTIPQQLKGEYIQLSPESTRENDLQTRVRWGGTILETRPKEDHTCFEILSRQLEKSMRPVDSDQTNGRFIACRPGFYDPEVFEKGREVTVTGKLVYIDMRKVGEYEYHYPIVDIDFVSLWPERKERIYYDYWGPYYPYYWHYPPYRYYWRYPY